jgi:flagellar basal-body rod protein FlgB
MRVFDGTLARLERSLDVRLVRQNVLAANLANVDTPGFRPKDVDFAATMTAIEGSAGHGAEGTPSPGGTDGMGAGAPGQGIPADDLPIVDVPAGGASLDGNTVDLDRTMVAMAENALQYAASARAAGVKLGILRYVASDGNG